MRKIIAYDIPGSNTVDGLIDLVKDYIKYGWQAYQAPFKKEEERVTTNQKEEWIYQPMVKYEE